MSSAVQNNSLPDADVLIQPRIENFSWTDLDALSELIEAGEGAAREQLDHLWETLRPSFWTRVKKWVLGSSPDYS